MPVFTLDTSCVIHAVPFRIDFGYSHLDGPDVLVSDEQALVIGAVETSSYRASTGSGDCGPTTRS